MFKNKKIAVIIPAFNEEQLIAKSIESVPLFVDHIIVIDDESTDSTLKVIKNLNKERLILIEHERNQGVGGAIISGYKKTLDISADVAVVFAGDAQMDPLDMPGLLEPIIQGKAEYTKGNRLSNFNVVMVMPKIRLLGNIILTLITKFTSGYWKIIDSQCGYTAITKEMLLKIHLNSLYKRYGFPNDMLAKLNVLNAKVKDVEVKAMYNNNTSKINIYSFAPRILSLSIKLLIWRIYHKYIATNLHSLDRPESQR